MVSEVGTTLENSGQVVTNGKGPFISAGIVVHTHVGSSEHPR